MIATATAPLAGFDEYLARKRDENPTFRRHLDGLSAADRERHLGIIRREFAYRCSEIYTDAFRIRELADELSGRMAAFAARYDGREGADILAAAGIPDTLDNPGRDRFVGAVEAVTGFAYMVGLLIGALNEEQDEPIILGAES